MFNTGVAAAVFQVRAGAGATGPWTYTVGPHDELEDTWDFRALGETTYDLSVYGPNGFLRAVKGSLELGAANVVVQTIYEPDRNAIVLEIRNLGPRIESLHTANAYSGQRATHRVLPGELVIQRFALSDSFGWYDVTLTAESDGSFQQQIAGHLETGSDSASDPALGR